MKRVTLHTVTGLGRVESINVDLDSISVMLPFSGGKTELWIGERSLYVSEDMAAIKKMVDRHNMLLSVEPNPNAPDEQKNVVKPPEKKTMVLPVPGPIKPPVRGGTNSSALG